MKSLTLFVVSLAPTWLCAPHRQSDPCPRPQMLTREQWGAKPPVPPWREHKPFRITIHHAGVGSNHERSLIDKLQGLQAFSQREDKLASGQTKPPWPDIPYHWYIDIHGQIAEARDPSLAGDTNTEYDPAGHLLIVLEGNFEVEEPTAGQIRALDAMVMYLAEKYGVRPEHIGAHKDFAQTSCPGKNLYPEVAKLRDRWSLALKTRGK